MLTPLYLWPYFFWGHRTSQRYCVRTTIIINHRRAEHFSKQSTTDTIGMDLSSYNIDVVRVTNRKPHRKCVGTYIKYIWNIIISFNVWYYIRIISYYNILNLKTKYILCKHFRWIILYITCTLLYTIILLKLFPFRATLYPIDIVYDTRARVPYIYIIYVYKYVHFFIIHIIILK